MYVDSLLFSYIVSMAVFSLLLQVSCVELSSSVKVEEELHQSEEKVSHLLPMENSDFMMFSSVNNTPAFPATLCPHPQVLTLTKEWTSKWGETQSILQVDQ